MQPLTAAELRRRLAGTALADDPRHVVLPPEFDRWPAELRQRVPRRLKAAGVLVPVVDRRDGLSVLLTRRAAHLRYHPGQVSFPGGRMESGDADAAAAALREAHEEVGITRRDVEVAGYLEPVLTVSGYAVTPVVGLIRPDVQLVIDAGEVQHAFEVPLAFLLDAGNVREGTREVAGRQLPVIEYRYAGERIWGVTAAIVISLRSMLVDFES
ncbi:MAG TPA: CoA pyrophosphatase [Woeseiaceae bacterium]